MTYFIVSMILVGLCVSFVRRRRFMRTRQLHQSFINIQCAALSAHDAHEVIEDPPFDSAMGFELEDGFCCAYWIERGEDCAHGHTHVHKIAGRLSDDGPQKRLIQKMLLLMSELTTEFKSSNIQDKIKFQVANLDEQTHLVHFTLTHAQHQALMAHVNEVKGQLT